MNPKADTQATKIPFREFRWQGPYKVERVLPNNNYIVRRLGTNKNRIRLRKFTPQSPLADIFVRETDWQKDDQMPIEHDDLYAQSWNTNFGPNPFEDNHPELSQDVEDTEYLPTTEPEHNHPPSREISQNGGGAQWNRPQNQIKIMKFMRMKTHNNLVKMAKKPKNRKKNQIIHQITIPKKPQKTPKIHHCKKNP